MAALWNKRLREPTADPDRTVLRLLRDRRDQLSAARAQALNRLHRLFLGLVPGQALLVTLQPWRATAGSRIGCGGYLHLSGRVHA
jgi:hypothetical protein